MKKRLQNKNTPKVTVVVCTNDRDSLLEKALASLSVQTVDKNDYEVIVVDNCPSLVTKNIVNKFEKDIDTKYLKENRTGLSRAKNMGWKEAGSKYVAFLDDDALAGRKWLEEIIDFAEKHPEVACYGGPYFGYTIQPKPSWFPPEYGSFTLGTKEREIKPPKESLSGSNTIYKRQILQKFGGFKNDLGMKGTKLSYGEDTRLIFDIANRGYSIYYSPKIKIKHLISEKKLSLRWLLKDRFIRGTLWTTIHGRDFSLFDRLSRTWKSLSKLKFFFDSGKGPIKRRIYYMLGPLLSNLGGLFYYLKSRFES